MPHPHTPCHPIVEELDALLAVVIAVDKAVIGPDHSVKVLRDALLLALFDECEGQISDEGS